jgi:hypothetical protein
MSATRAIEPSIAPESERRQVWTNTMMDCVECGWARVYCHPVGVEPKTDNCECCGTNNWKLFDAKRRDWRTLH